MLPFSLSYGVCSMFHYLLPSTRNLYSSLGWKTGVWLDICGLLSGIAWSIDTIDDLRYALFNEKNVTEEENEEDLDDDEDNNKNNNKNINNINNSNKEEDSNKTTSSSSNNSKQLDIPNDQSSLDYESYGLNESASRSIDWKKIKNNSDEIRGKQPRLKFYSGSPSPVYSLIVNGGPKVKSVLKRSQTIENCPVGGSRTYVSVNIGETIRSVKDLMRASMKRREVHEQGRI